MKLSAAQVRFLKSMLSCGHPALYCRTRSDHGGLRMTLGWAARNGLIDHSLRLTDKGKRLAEEVVRCP